MLYGTVSKVLNGYAWFNHEVHIVYERETQDPNGEWIIYDTSGSMEEHKTVLKHAFSAHMAIFGCVGQYHLPALGGGTDVLGSWAKIARIIGAGGKVTWVTDCYDMVNRNKTRQFGIRMAEDGTIVYSDLETCSEMTARLPTEPPAPQHAEGASPEDMQLAEQEYATTFDEWEAECDRVHEEWESKWFDVCLQHLQMGGANVSVIGVGSEIQKVIAEACKNVAVRVNLAWLPSNATPEQVTNVTVATHRREPRPTLTASDNSAASTTTVITIDAPEAQPAAVQLNENALTTVVSAAARTRIGDSVTVDSLKDLFTSMEAHTFLQDASYNSINKSKARTALLWFLDMATRGQPLAGGLLGGMRGRLFCDPDVGGTGKTTWHKYLNACLSALADGKGGLGLFTSHKKAASNIKVGAGDTSLYFGFHDAPHYTLKMTIDKDVLDVLRADAEFAPPESGLTKVASGNSSASKYEAAVAGGGSSSGSPTAVANGGSRKRRRAPNDPQQAVAVPAPASPPEAEAMDEEAPAVAAEPSSADA